MDLLIDIYSSFPTPQLKPVFNADKYRAKNEVSNPTLYISSSKTAARLRSAWTAEFLSVLEL